MQLMVTVIPGRAKWNNLLSKMKRKKRENIYQVLATVAMVTVVSAWENYKLMKST